MQYELKLHIKGFQDKVSLGNTGLKKKVKKKS